MKETYPAPRVRKKPPAPSVRRDYDVPKNAHPNAVLHTNQPRWEEAVFRHAAYFTVCTVRRPRGEPSLKNVRYWRKEFPTFSAAIAEAQGKQVLVYACTADGRSVCLPKKEWGKYAKIWLETHPL